MTEPGENSLNRHGGGVTPSGSLHSAPQILMKTTLRGAPVEMTAGGSLIEMSASCCLAGAQACQRFDPFSETCWGILVRAKSLAPVHTR